MATDGQPLEQIGELLRVTVGSLDLSLKSVLHDAVERVVAALRYFIFDVKVLDVLQYMQKNSEVSSADNTYVHTEIVCKDMHCQMLVNLLLVTSQHCPNMHNDRES